MTLLAFGSSSQFLITTLCSEGGAPTALVGPILLFILKGFSIAIFVFATFFCVKIGKLYF